MEANEGGKLGEGSVRRSSSSYSAVDARFAGEQERGSIVGSSGSSSEDFVEVSTEDFPEGSSAGFFAASSEGYFASLFEEISADFSRASCMDSFRLLAEEVETGDS